MSLQHAPVVNQSESRKISSHKQLATASIVKTIHWDHLDELPNSCTWTISLLYSNNASHLCDVISR